MSNEQPDKSQRPDSPPGHEDEPGRRQAGAPGQQKPRPVQLPTESDEAYAQRLRDEGFEA